MKEIEKKFKVQSFEKIQEVLAENQYIADGSKEERDIYFNVSGRDSMSTKECLRIRDYGYKQEITYKCPTVQEQLHFSKEEIDLPITDIDQASRLLLATGNTVLVDFTKSRTLFRKEGVTIALDVLNKNLFFVEIEVMSEDEGNALVLIESVQKILSLTDDMIEKRPYRDIAMGK